MAQGWKLQINSTFPLEKCKQDLPVWHSGQANTQIEFQTFSLSFGKVSKFFSCPSVFLPVLERQTVYNFNP